MALIAFLIDIEEGHLFPSFALARLVQRRGHSILYIGVLDHEEFIKEQGFEFYPVYKDILPRGFNKRTKEKFRDHGDGNAILEKTHLDHVIGDDFSQFWNVRKPDLLIISSFLRMEALILYYKFHMKCVMFNPIIREPGTSVFLGCIDDLSTIKASTIERLLQVLTDQGISITTLSELAAPINDFYELVACPKEILTDGGVNSERVRYLGPCIFGRKPGKAVSWLTEAAKGRKIIYASMGSQAIRYGSICRFLFNSIISAMESDELKDYYMVLATCGGIDKKDLIQPGDNVAIVEWTSQIEVIRVASLVIGHGGLGSIKECVYYGVPMIVIPITRDQPKNAERISFHNLGVSISPDKITRDMLVQTILGISGNDSIKESLLKMQQIFVTKDADGLGADIIESCLNTVN